VLKSWLLVAFEQGLEFQRTKKVIGQAEAHDRFVDISCLSSLCVAKATSFTALNR
jgi:hypothetical protein